MSEHILEKIEQLIESSTSIEKLLKDIFSILKELDDDDFMEVLEEISYKVYEKIGQLGNSDELIKIKEELAENNWELDSFSYFDKFMRFILYRILDDENKLESIFFGKGNPMDKLMERYEKDFYVYDFYEFGVPDPEMGKICEEDIFTVFIIPEKLMEKYNLTEKEAKKRAKTNIFNFMDSLIYSILESDIDTDDFTGEIETFLDLLKKEETILYTDKKFVKDFITRIYELICEIEDTSEIEGYLVELIERIPASTICDTDFLEEISKVFGNYDDLREYVYIIDSMHEVKIERFCYNYNQNTNEEIKEMYNNIDEETRFKAEIWSAIKKQYEKTLCKVMTDSFNPSSYDDLTDKEACEIARQNICAVFEEIERRGYLGYFNSITINDIVQIIDELEDDVIRKLFSNADFTYNVIEYIYNSDSLEIDKKEEHISYIIIRIRENISFNLLTNTDFLDMMPENIRTRELKLCYEKYKAYYERYKTVVSTNKKNANACAEFDKRLKTLSELFE